MSAMSGVRAWIIKEFRVPELQTKIDIETLSLSRVKFYPRLAIPVEARISELVTKKASLIKKYKLLERVWEDCLEEYERSRTIEIVTAEREAVLEVFNETLARDSNDRSLDDLARKALVLCVELQELDERLEHSTVRKRRPSEFSEGLAKKGRTVPPKILSGQRRMFGYLEM